MNSNNNLDNNKIDFLTSAAKSIVGAVPLAGSFLSELVGNIIPNQRIDRLTKYLKELDARFSKIPVERINFLLGNDDFVDLIEEGFVQASRATSEERRQYISSIVANGITDESISLLESKYLLKIIEELNDVEIIWLRSYFDPIHKRDKEFRDKHKNILTLISPDLSSDKETFRKSAFQNSYKEHLERLDLISHKIRVDHNTGLPEFDKYSGKTKTSYTEVTILGRLLLKQIGLINEKEESNY
jgi:hypothetical protein